MQVAGCRQDAGGATLNWAWLGYLASAPHTTFGTVRGEKNMGAVAAGNGRMQGGRREGSGRQAAGSRAWTTGRGKGGQRRRAAGDAR